MRFAYPFKSKTRDSLYDASQRCSQLNWPDTKFLGDHIVQKLDCPSYKV